MTTAAIRKKLHDLIDTADDRHVEAVYSIFEDEMTEKYDPWENEEFVKEMDQRIKDFENGKDKGVSWEEVKLKARSRLTARHDRIENQTDKSKKMNLMKKAAFDPLFLGDMKEISEDFKASIKLNSP